MNKKQQKTKRDKHAIITCMFNDEYYFAKIDRVSRAKMYKSVTRSSADRLKRIIKTKTTPLQSSWDFNSICSFHYDNGGEYEL